MNRLDLIQLSLGVALLGLAGFQLQAYGLSGLRSPWATGAYALGGATLVGSVLLSFWRDRARKGPGSREP